jgi:hypothetical protein
METTHHHARVGSARTRLAVGFATATLALSSGAISHAETAPKNTEKLPVVPAARTVANQLARDCKSFGFVDVERMASIAPVAENKAVLRDRMRDAIAEAQGSQWAGAAKAARSALSALGGQGMKWQDVDAIAGCMTRKGDAVVTLAGSWPSDAVDALIRAGAKQDKKTATVVPVTKNGRRYAELRAQGQRYYAASITPGVLGISPTTETLDSLAKPAGGSTTDLGADDLARFRAQTPDGRTIETGFSKLEAAFAITSKITKENAFDPMKDGDRYRNAVRAWGERVGQTPLAPIARAVSASAVSVTDDQVRIRTVVTPENLREAVANSAKSPGQHWSALFDGITIDEAKVKAIGGGPSAGGSKK